MKFDLHIVQTDRETCEVPGCGMTPDQGNVGLDWDHCILPKNKRFEKFVDNPFNMLRACAICNRITHLSDHWEAKKWLIDYHMDGEYRAEFLEWIYNLPPRMLVPFLIYNYIATKLDEEG